MDLQLLKSTLLRLTTNGFYLKIFQMLSEYLILLALFTALYLNTLMLQSSMDLNVLLGDTTLKVIKLNTLIMEVKKSSPTLPVCKDGPRAT